MKKQKRKRRKTVLWKGIMLPYENLKFCFGSLGNPIEKPIEITIKTLRGY